MMAIGWLGTPYLCDCPDQVARTAAVRIFRAALQSCIVLEEDQGMLERWAQACREQLAKIGTIKDPLPSILIIVRSVRAASAKRHFKF
jgi:hypothetical protein